MCKNKSFWLENPLQLFCTFNVIPLDGMSWEEKMNSLSRFTIILFVIFYLLNCKFNFSFLVISLMFIIVLYYFQRENTNKKEYYDEKILSNKTMVPFSQTENRYSSGMNKDYSEVNIPDKFLSNKFRYYYDGKDNNNVSYLNFDKELDTGNQQWVGKKADPRTKNAPIITSPPYCEAWMENSNIVPSGINSATNEYLYRSGYTVSDSCEDISPCLPEKYNFNQQYKQIPNCHIKDFSQSRYGTKIEDDENVIENYQGQLPSLDQLKLGACCNDNLTQLQKFNLPSNYNASKFEKQDKMKLYNQNLFTQNINDQTLSRSELIEPINSNMGISYAFQFEPVEVEQSEDGVFTYVSKDPRNIVEKSYKKIDEPNTSNVYDPRSTGYGTSYRSYFEPVTGQTRFYYDDVDAIRKPNSIARNNIDFASFSQQYEPMKSNREIAMDNRNVRYLAEQTFLNNSIGFRNDIQERLSRNYNNKIGWQRRQAPIHTMGQTSGRYL